MRTTNSVNLICCNCRNRRSKAWAVSWYYENPSLSLFMLWCIHGFIRRTCSGEVHCQGAAPIFFRALWHTAAETFSMAISKIAISAINGCSTYSVCDFKECSFSHLSNSYELWLPSLIRIDGCTYVCVGYVHVRWWIISLVSWRQCRFQVYLTTHMCEEYWLVLAVHHRTWLPDSVDDLFTVF